MIKRLFMGIVIVTSISALNGMISYNHSETDSGQNVFTVGDVHTLDQITEPGLSSKLMAPLARVLSDIKPPLRLPVVLEMNAEFLRTGAASVIALFAMV